MHVVIDLDRSYASLMAQMGIQRYLPRRLFRHGSWILAVFRLLEVRVCLLVPHLTLLHRTDFLSLTLSHTVLHSGIYGAILILIVSVNERHAIFMLHSLLIYYYRWLLHGILVFSGRNLRCLQLRLFALHGGRGEKYVALGQRL